MLKLLYGKISEPTAVISVLGVSAHPSFWVHQLQNVKLDAVIAYFVKVSVPNYLKTG
ncbi:hypothetical protein OGM63_19140 [Plectonema radiosum NIES-515]|uniref:Uncharacterized protein n=1 Tax=Plectonema radiosum NIES-515 TaxID=2986073 RepID=A0ABT3B2J8_9CYAN|nr:hypothetical protein [Plectonema radiosum]MCV3215601.1 hypothetical protein [Plectonema radiosum NIES-515]